MLSVVVFDADETLIDLRPAVTGALVAVLEEMRRRTPVAAGVTLAEVESDWQAVFGSMTRRTGDGDPPGRAGPVARPGRAGRPARRVRRTLLRPAVRAQPPVPRHPAGAGRPARRLHPGYATNGNSRAERCGLPGAFAFELYAHENGLPKKPAPAFYAAIVDAAGVPAERIAYVGDSLAHDVLGPQQAGLRGIWLNRLGLPLPAGVRPDAEVGTLTELAAVLRSLQPTNA